MTAAVCGAADILRTGGPVAVPFRHCCAVALIRVGAAAGGASTSDAVDGCPFGADPAAEAQLLLMTEPVAVGDP